MNHHNKFFIIFIIVLFYLNIIFCNRHIDFNEGEIKSNDNFNFNDDLDKHFSVVFSKKDDFTLSNKKPDSNLDDNRELNTNDYDYLAKYGYFWKSEGVISCITGYNWNEKEGVIWCCNCGIWDFNVGDNPKKGTILDIKKRRTKTDWVYMDVYTTVYNNRYVLFINKGFNCVDLQDEKGIVTGWSLISEKNEYKNLKGETESFTTDNATKRRSSAVIGDMYYVVEGERVLGFKVQQIIDNKDIPQVVEEYGKKGKSYVSLDGQNIRDKDTTLLGATSLNSNIIVGTSKFTFIQNPRGYDGNVSNPSSTYNGYTKTISLFDSNTRKMIKEISSVEDINGSILNYDVSIVSAYYINEDFTMLLLRINSSGKVSLGIYKNSDFLDPIQKTLKPFQILHLPNLKFINDYRTSNFVFNNNKAYVIYKTDNNTINCEVYDVSF